MKRVVIESPYAGDVARNLRYVRACMRDALMRGEAPYASHALYTQPGVLRDDVPEERELGIRAGFAWRAASEVTAVYQDLGISSGMQLGVRHAAEAGAVLDFRRIEAWESDTGSDSASDNTPTDADIERAHATLLGAGTYEQRVAQLIADVRAEERDKAARRVARCEIIGPQLRDTLVRDLRSGEP